MFSELAVWTKENPAFNDVALMLPRDLPWGQVRATGTTSEGYVYLIQSGCFHKVGRGDGSERRVQ